ncbi:hypothetical protein B0H14DRAFT_3427133 [Mycena olivaceomarginata]|nr:hypothetical protein B0H14DRAFT_3427133 [Mycena olivaceomarginata]
MVMGPTVEWEKGLKLALPPFEFHSPAKASKAKEGDFQLDKDRRDRPRKSPTKRKGAITSSSNLDIVTGESYLTDDDDEDDEPDAVARRSRPLHPLKERYAPRDDSPTPGAPRTANTSLPKYSPTASNMSLDNNKDVVINPAPPPPNRVTQGQHATDVAAQQKRDADLAAQQQRDVDLAAQQQHDADAAAQQQRAADAAAQRQRDADAAAAAAVVNAAAATAQALAAQQLAAQQAAAFVMPTTAVLMAHTPPSRARNPSLLFQAAQPAPPVDVDLGRARFQHNNGQFRNHTVTNDAMTRGIAPSQLEDFLSSPGTKILLPIANGGRQFFQVNFETPLDDQIKLAQRALAPTSEINIRLPVPANQYTSGTAKYGGPRSVLVDIDDATEAAAVVANKTYALHEGLAFWAHDYHANAATRNWAFAHYSSMVEVPAGTPDHIIEASARTGLIQTAYKNQAAFHKVDVATQARGGPAPHRVFDAFNTMHAEFVRYPGRSPVVIMYLEPLTDNAVEMEELYARNGEPPECVVCESADHPSYACHYTNMDPKWWGPSGQLSDSPTTTPSSQATVAAEGEEGEAAVTTAAAVAATAAVTAVALAAAAVLVAAAAAEAVRRVVAISSLYKLTIPNHIGFFIYPLWTHYIAGITGLLAKYHP